MAIILGTLQVGDSTRQRLDHFVSALQMLEGQAEGSTAVIVHVDRLLAAQIEAAMADFGRETCAMLASLAELASTRRRCSR